MPSNPFPDVRPLVDFLNHGLLPQTGREREHAQLLSFWRMTSDAEGIRVAILRGEAGIGKSRLIESVTAAIEQEGGMVVHLKLYENTAASLHGSMTRAITATRLGGKLRGSEETADAIAALPLLRRVARLRSTLVVIEDLHLLEGEGLDELARLLRGMSDETLSFIAVTRPVELPSRGILEPWIAEEIELGGLDAERIGLLWSRLFEGAPPEGLISALHDATLGNPLALRSALRGAIRSELLVPDPATGGWRISGSIPRMRQQLKRNVEILSEGMASHLSPAERHAAGQLALLGEVISREAAAAMMEKAPDAIGRLLFAGILVTSSLPTALLPGDESRTLPLAFTHTLVHRFFVASAERSPDRLLETIASGRPLYSILPFQILEEIVDPEIVDHRLLLETLRRAIDIAMKLDETPDWKLGLQTWRSASALFFRCIDRWSDAERLELEAALLNLRLTLYRREDYGEEYERLVERLLEITATPVSPELEEYGVLAHAFRQRFVWRQTRTISQQTWDAVAALTGRRPRLLYTIRFLVYLEAMARSALYSNNLGFLRTIESQLDRLLGSPEAAPDYILTAKRRFYPLLLPLFDNASELERRLAMLAELEQITDDRMRPTMLTFKVGFLDQIGDVAGVLATTRHAIPLFRALDLSNNYYHASLDAIAADVARGADLDDAVERAMALVADAPEDVADLLRVHFARKLSGLAILCGRFDLAESVMGRVEEHERHPYRAALALQMIERHAKDERRLAEEMRRLLVTAPGESLPTTVVRLLAGEQVDRGETIAEATRMLDDAFLRTTDILFVAAIVALLRTADRLGVAPGLMEVMAPVVEASLSVARAWIIRNDLQVFGRLLDHPMVSGGKKKPAAHGARVRTAAVERKENGHMIEISMLGRITVHVDGQGSAASVRGARLRTMLGVLVADRMLQTPLSYREMAHLALDESDGDRARVAFNGVIYRLRNIMGVAAIMTDTETPMLDLRLVRVDLLDARAAILRVSKALKRGSLVQARRHLLTAFELIHGEVAFPSLYGNFFEAIREDFERSLRGATLAVAGGMISEGDLTGGEELLQLGCDAMPGDQEIQELLCDALTQLGKGVEAARIRLRMQFDMQG